jgi:asparagine synthase (glutamine-hydrolysing)
MCGIAGLILSSGAPPPDPATLSRLIDSLAHRGPDGTGHAVVGRVALVHSRLSIIDLVTGDQPLFAGPATLVCNGEIYNYRELRVAMPDVKFATNSDCEPPLHLWLNEGADYAKHLRGMYAIAIHERQQHSVTLTRDPFGIKPLYYADDGATFRFATLVGALIEGGRVDTGEDVAGIAGFYLFGCVPEPFTFHRAVRSLPAGSTLRVGRGTMREPAQYFSVTEEFRKAEAAPSALAPSAMDEQIRAVFSDSMRYHMVADVPVGVFLSSGVDSSVLAALGAELNREKLHAITLGFREYRGTLNDETVLAEKHAAQLGIRQTSRWIERSDFRDDWRAFFAGMDQPSTDGVNSYLVSKAAAACELKVAISGLGGDELFGG